MKKLKKILSVVLTLAMVLGMSVTTWAAENPDGVVGTRDDKGDIVVHGIEEANLSNTQAVKAYPIVTAKYDSNGNFEGYENPYEITLEGPSKTELDEISIDDLSGIDLSYDAESQTYKVENQPVGMYLIVVPSNDSTTYSKAVASIFYSNDEGKNVLNSADLTMTTKVTSPDLWVKKNVDVNVDKTVKPSSDATGTPGNTANIGDTLYYEVTIDSIPNYNGKYPKLKVTDVLSAGLTYGDDLKVYIGDSTTPLIADKYIAKYDEATRTLTVNFVEEKTTADGTTYTYLLGADEVGKSAVIKYTAVLNDSAALNGKDNGNTVTLEYTRDSSVENDGDSSTDKTHTYTFDIDGQTSGSITEKIINKVGQVTSTTTKPLDGATFTLYQNKTGLDSKNYDTNDAFKKAITDIESNVYTNDTFKGTTTTANDGQMKITGLAAGTYYLKETAAPEEYSLNTHVFEIEIVAVPDAGTGLLSAWSIEIDGTPTATFSVNNTADTVQRTDTNPGIDIQNTKLSSLPSTGGIGTTIFTIGGCAIMILAAGLYFASRRKSAK